MKLSPNSRKLIGGMLEGLAEIVEGFARLIGWAIRIVAWGAGILACLYAYAWLAERIGSWWPGDVAYAALGVAWYLLVTGIESLAK